MGSFVPPTCRFFFYFFLSRILAAASTVLAYSAFVEIENVQGTSNPSFSTAPILSFTAGSVALVLNVLAAWGRTHAIERNEALNSIQAQGPHPGGGAFGHAYESVGDQPPPTNGIDEDEEDGVSA